MAKGLRKSVLKMTIGRPIRSGEVKPHRRRKPVDLLGVTFGRLPIALVFGAAHTLHARVRNYWVDALLAQRWRFFSRTTRNAAWRFSPRASCRPLRTTLRYAAVRRRVAIVPVGCDRHLRAIRDAHPAHDVAHMDLHSALA